VKEEDSSLKVKNVRSESDSEEKILNELNKLTKKYLTFVKNEANAKKIKEVERSFKELAKKTNEIAKKISDREDINSPMSSLAERGLICRISLCGYLEGDFSERSYFPVSLMGGFFIETEYGNILLEPGTGTRVGMRDLGINIAKETDLIIISHYHHSVHGDFHLILNDMKAFDPVSDKEVERKIDFMSTRAFIEGRDGYPPKLIVNYDKVINNKHILKPDSEWIMSKPEGNVSLLENRNGELLPKNSIRIKTYPAYHNEVSMRAGDDIDAIKGCEVSSILLYNNNLKIFFTSDTQYSEEYKNNIVKDLKEINHYNDDNLVDVLIANMKTLELSPKIKTPAVGRSLSNLGLTKNQLGFEGTLRLACELKPRILVLRALGLECVVDFNDETKGFDYKPENLIIIHSMLELLLKKNKCSVNRIIIPIRHKISIDVNHEIKDEALIPAILEQYKIYGNFITGDVELINKIQIFSEIFRDNEKNKQQAKYEDKKTEKPNKRPFMVIEGVTGSGKTTLAHGIAKYVLDNYYKNDDYNIEMYDLSIAESDERRFSIDLFGVEDKVYTDVSKRDGLLAQRNILILNQLEKLPKSVSKMFLDVLEEWKFRTIGSKVAQQEVKAKIIFTTNTNVELLNIQDDVKNRLSANCLTISDINKLSPEERKRELSLLLTHLCRRAKVVVDYNSWDLLMRVDLSKGAGRCINNIILAAKRISEYRHAIPPSKDEDFQIFINSDDILKAMSELNIGFPQKDKSINKKTFNLDIIWVIGLWISYNFIDKNVYLQFRDQGNQDKKIKTNQNIRRSPQAFKNYYIKNFFISSLNAQDIWSKLREPKALTILNNSPSGFYEYCKEISKSDTHRK